MNKVHSIHHDFPVPLYWTFQEYMVNGQCVNTMLACSRRSSGQDMGLGGLGVASLKSGYYNLITSVTVVEFHWP